MCPLYRGMPHQFPFNDRIILRLSFAVVHSPTFRVAIHYVE